MRSACDLLFRVTDFTYDTVNLEPLILTLAPTPSEAASIDATIDAFGRARDHAVTVGRRALS